MPSSILTNIINADIDRLKTVLEGRTTTRPVLFLGDEAANSVYVVNVDIGEDEVMRDVPIAQGNQDLRYADIGSPVALRRTAQRWTVVGFSKVMPGTRTQVLVTVPNFDFGLPTYTIGVITDLTFTIRALTYGELSTLGTGYGNTPYGAQGKFQGGVLQEIF
jgi:hypothetical protein